jgi:hypothetical protein
VRVGATIGSPSCAWYLSSLWAPCISWGWCEEHLYGCFTSHVRPCPSTQPDVLVDSGYKHNDGVMTLLMVIMREHRELCRSLMLHLRVDSSTVASTPPPLDPSQLFDFVGRRSLGVFFFSPECITNQPCGSCGWKCMCYGIYVPMTCFMKKLCEFLLLAWRVLVLDQVGGEVE